MDIERVAAQRLMDATGIKAVLEVPKRRPSEFISVEMTGGSGDRFMRTASLCSPVMGKDPQASRRDSAPR